MNGTYVLIIEAVRDTELEVGHRGLLTFSKGYYAYVGSALSGLESRIRRHLRKPGDTKRLHWHIDFLLADPAVRVTEVVCSESEERGECEIAAYLGAHLNSVAHFGCSDCSCFSHLFFSASYAELQRQVYRGFHAGGATTFRAMKIKPV
ncbi:MAG TPA: GIY-YIG nuclease family protein [Methanomicrobia archaeon]|nr:GIY-YIG nuclease family protein [Methanomicrobia archaeon]